MKPLQSEQWLSFVESQNLFEKIEKKLIDHAMSLCNEMLKEKELKKDIEE